MGRGLLARLDADGLREHIQRHRLLPRPNFAATTQTMHVLHKRSPSLEMRFPKYEYCRRCAGRRKYVEGFRRERGLSKVVLFDLSRTKMCSRHWWSMYCTLFR